MNSTISCIAVPGRKMPFTPIAFQLRDVDGGNDSANHHQDVVQTMLGEQRHQPRHDVVVGAGQNRQSDDVGVLLQRRRGDMFRCLAQPGVDHLHAGVAEGARNHLGAPVVAIEARLGNDDHPDFLIAFR